LNAAGQPPAWPDAASLCMLWDGEAQPSVECPLYDFFCDPDGALERVYAALVNKRRGWNAYFPMPFAKSARIEVSNERSASWNINPCYSYVMYRTLKELPKDAAYFHAQWRQRMLLMGKEDYQVFDAEGRGQFVGWNVTIRGVGAPEAGYPVDENEKFHIDGEETPSQRCGVAGAVCGREVTGDPVRVEALRGKAYPCNSSTRWIKYKDDFKKSGEPRTRGPEVRKRLSSR
jgi:hypothetical protein